MNVCFLPGSLCDARVFGPQINAVTEAGAYCQVVDLSSLDSIDAMAAKVIEQTPTGTILVGLSMGAIVAAEVVAQAPHHVAAIALMNTNLDVPDDRQLELRRLWASQVRSGEFVRMVIDNLTEALTVDPQHNNELIFDMARAAGPGGFLAQNTALLNRRDRRDDLASFEGPTLVIASSDDHICPPALHRDLCDRIPHATLQVIGQAGHLSTIDQPDIVNDHLVEWLYLCNKQIHTQEGTHEYQHA